MSNNNKNKLSNYWIIDKIDISNQSSLLYESDDISYYMKMAALRRSISDFVQIVTNKSIPVEFLLEDSSYTDEKTVYLSSQIDGDIDPTVGLALHEGSHILLTDFSLLYSLDLTINESLCNLAEHKGLSKKGILYLVKSILNYVEDRRIDNYMYNTAPGYQGYYIELYDKYFNSPLITKAIKSNEYRTETLDSYEFRFFNLTNPYTDLTALKGLKEISDILDLDNINRLKNTMDSLVVAYNICEIILKYIEKMTDEQSKKYDISRDSKDDNNNNDEYDVLSASESDQLLHDIENQRKFILGKINKSTMSSETKNYIDVVQNSKTEIKTIDINSSISSSINTKSQCDIPPYNVIVIHKVTESMCNSTLFSFINPEGHYTMKNAIREGILIGKQLGRKLQIRNEQKLTTYIRQRTGNIDKRLLFELGLGNENILKYNFVEEYTDAILHISVDISQSMMQNNKLVNAFKCVTAICQAASMTNGNLNVVVDVRHTDNQPTPVIAIIYDSRIDTMSKVKKIFPKIKANGCTPEGICFSAIENIISSTTTKLHSYFLNLSDGEPFFTNYSGKLAAEHTRNEINKMRKRGIKVLSYLIGKDNFEDFNLMYGKSAEVIDTSNLLDIARTINKLFINDK